ncbi:hypothetical protein BDK51DRAFT_48461, partial [Blyttiomyces helicus]
VHNAFNPDLTRLPFAPFDSTPEVFDNDIFKQALLGKCLVPFDCFLAETEPYKGFVQQFAKDENAFLNQYSESFNFFLSFSDSQLSDLPLNLTIKAVPQRKPAPVPAPAPAPRRAPVPKAPAPAPKRLPVPAPKRHPVPAPKPHHLERRAGCPFA